MVVSSIIFVVLVSWCVFRTKFYCFCRFCGKNPPWFFVSMVSGGGGGLTHVSTNVSKSLITILSISIIVCAHSPNASLLVFYNFSVSLEIVCEFFAKKFVWNVWSSAFGTSFGMHGVGGNGGLAISIFDRIFSTIRK